MIKTIELTKERKRLIESYYGEPVDPDKVLLFSFNAADNDIDSNNEKFSLKALNTISKLLIGKNMFLSQSNYGLRVIESEVHIDASVTSICGDPYVYVYGVAYIIKNEYSSDLYDGILDGEFAEISISTSCTGKYKQGEYTVIDDVTDIYKLSFVYPPSSKTHKLIRADKLIEEIKNHDYDVTSKLGTCDKGMFTESIIRIINKLPAEKPIHTKKESSMQELAEKYFPDYKLLDPHMREFLNEPENIKRIVEFLFNSWKHIQEILN